ncbi:hypothetical protein GCM10010339_86650 [Streptomyces alanosinicus]|uniref:Uncharacterized protein n=1 Tax=Streptomyces alanosinicus TaxID=68171 RepID=A0A918YUR3_9ACTN|nr:hypothetical protein GCM10010339_86650 [Streptomyces alanosinicus]
MISDVPVGLIVSPTSGQREIVEADDAEHGVVNAVAFHTAVAEDLTRKWPCEGMPDAGADLAMGGVVFLLRVR